MPSPTDRHPLPNAAPAGDLDVAALARAALWEIHETLAGECLHALRGELNAIALKVELLRSNGAVGSPADAGALEAVRCAVLELGGTVADVLDLGWLRNTTAGAVDLQRLLEQVCAMVRPPAKRRRIEVLPIDVPSALHVLGEPHAILAVVLAPALDLLHRAPAASVLEVRGGRGPATAATVTLALRAATAAASRLLEGPGTANDRAPWGPSALASLVAERLGARVSWNLAGPEPGVGVDLPLRV